MTHSSLWGWDCLEYVRNLKHLKKFKGLTAKASLSVSRDSEFRLLDSVESVETRNFEVSMNACFLYEMTMSLFGQE